MPQRTAAEIESLRDQLNEAEQQLSERRSSPASVFEKIDRAERILRFAWWMGGGILLGVIGVTIFYITVTTQLARQEKTIATNGETVAGISERQRDLREAVKANRDERMRDNDIRDGRIKRIEEWQEKWETPLRRMDELRKSGRSNKEDFFLEKGYSAPNSKE